MKLSHRTRLVLATTVTTGILLGLLFMAIVEYARQNAYSLKREALERAFSTLATVTEPGFDLIEFREINPDMSVGLYGKRGDLQQCVGRNVPDYNKGFSRTGDNLELGKPAKGLNAAVSLPLGETDEGISRLAIALSVLWLPLTLLVAGISWLAATSVFRPLEKLNAQALAMSGANLSDRLNTNDSAEFGQFAGQLNEMLARIQETVARGERFSTDAAHELRTPLAILRMRLETALIQTRTPEEYQISIQRSIEEIHRLTAVTESLLRSARGEIEPTATIDLAPVIADATERWTQPFREKSVRLDFLPLSALAQIRPEEVRILIDNLLDNALRFSPRGSKVQVTLQKIQGETRLLVNDEGPGIPAELGLSIFDRFVRADDSRNRSSGGAGIGLSVCRQIIEGRGGRMISLTDIHGGAHIGFLLPEP